MRPELKIIPPKPGRTPFYYLRGTYRGTYVERSTGETSRAEAQRQLVAERIRIGNIKSQGGEAEEKPLTFTEAAHAYMDYKGDRLGDLDKKCIAAVSLHFNDMPITKIKQAAIAAAAMRLVPNGSAATRNRHVYTPVSAILRHSEVLIKIKRPEGAQGAQRKHWLRPEQANALIKAAWDHHSRFAALLTTLLYTGCRLSEALRLRVEHVHLDEGFADVGVTKNGEPQRLHLPPVVVHAIRLALAEPGNATWIPKDPRKPKPGPRTKGTVFHLTKSGALYALLAKAEKASGVAIPPGVSFHIFRHTFGAWTRAAGGRLEETGRWTSRGGAKPYDHYEVTEAQRVADKFPGANGSGKLKEVG